MKTSVFVKAMIKSIPGIEYVHNMHKDGGGTTLNARYCYSVWLRHLIYSYENGWTSVPRKIAELGPGQSLGVGICALISGADQYFAFDVKKYNNSAQLNLQIFDELVYLLKKRAPIPEQNEFPSLKPSLKSYDFPDYIFPETYMAMILDDKRLMKIRNCIKLLDSEPTATENMITYMVPWNDSALIKKESVDMIISQGVLQHIEELQSTFEIMFKWLKPNGLMSHQITFKALGSSETWYGHWEYSDLMWKIIKGRMSYLINREPYSTYIKLFNKNNFAIVFESKIFEETVIEKRKLATRFKYLADEDLSISGLFIQATKKNQAI